MKSTDDYVTVTRQLLRESSKLIYHLASKVQPGRISQDESMMMAVLLTELQLAMTKRASE
jgi:hypothetical protein